MKLRYNKAAGEVAAIKRLGYRVQMLKSRVSTWVTTNPADVKMRNGALSMLYLWETAHQQLQAVAEKGEDTRNARQKTRMYYKEARSALADTVKFLKSSPLRRPADNAYAAYKELKYNI